MTNPAVSIVLVATTHSGNIGASARAMANMGLRQLRLVAPKAVIDADARTRASGADYILDSATIHPSLADALANARYAVGTTARRREISWPVLEPGRAAATLIEQINMADRDADCEVAIVFGRESSGLTNTELDLVDALVSIPVNPEFMSLNVASAVMIMAYEVRRQMQIGKLLELNQGPPESDDASIGGDTEAQSESRKDILIRAQKALPASIGEREYFFTHLQKVLEELDFIKANRSDKLMRKIRRVYARAQPDSEELRLLRGILTAIEHKTNE
ncbi:MAG: tRNA (cytidine/uridine-2'-O-)-methyltransferase TrmJ [marine bacterium B5-7]|nr:MAG: tRNA (cytidine/uridine-2'-O-)-methyltransferase TrmJ [marine bacterium B5-7]